MGKYRIIRRLAEGGMGEIFLARSEGSSGFEKVVVLKRILQQNMTDREAVRMFLDEARLMATLGHPNIVQVYDFGTAGGAHFFTMEYIHGEDLGRIMKAVTMDGGALSMEFAIGAIADAAGGLHYAHDKRGRDGQPLEIVHRDISPSNVLISYDGAVKVTDFGIAKWSQRETETRYGALKGKIAYMSPEQCRGEALDRRSDVFGLGILLYELTTGTRLFQGTSDYGILEQIVNHEVPPPSTRRAEYPGVIEQIVMKALSRDPDRRQESARALQLELEEYALEQRMKITAVSRAAEMEALFGHKIGAWREAAQKGRSLIEHLAAQPIEAPFAPTMQIDGFDPLAGPARTATVAEEGTTGALGKTAWLGPNAQESATKKPSGRRTVKLGIGAAAVGLLVMGGAFAVARRPLPAAPAIAGPASPASRPAVQIAREEPPVEETVPPPVATAPPAREPPARRSKRKLAAAPAAAKPDNSAAKPAAAPTKKKWDPDSIFLP